MEIPPPVDDPGTVEATSNSNDASTSPPGGLTATAPRLARPARTPLSRR
jgi:hypothetical protein